ncbi:MAG: DNA-processing protein DprA, partial [Sphingomonadales bacterium]|nr:DNA-processing protein DprA [Sphingomonadales bacterium]
ALEALPELAKRGGRKKPIKLCPKPKAEGELEKLAAFNADVLVLGEAHYPTPLANIEDAPPVLTMKGHAHLLDKKTIGVVGARNASTMGKKMAYQLSKDLGDAGFTICSGLARGVDTAAHNGALATGTIAVLGTGLDIIYPKENAELQERIANEGLLLSEHLCGTKPQAQHFPRRNRIISGLSLGTLVVEAALRSGSLITARMAGEQGRDVYAVPGSPLDPRAKGTNNLIRNGAQMVENAEDIIEAIETLHQHAFMEPTLTLFDDTGAGTFEQPDDELQNKIVDELTTTPIAIDDIIRETGLPTQVFLSCLLELELAGRISRHFGNKISLEI